MNNSELEPVCIRLKQRDGLGLRAMEGARIDDARAAHPLIVPDVGVALQ